jgi:hypothetical protein
MSAVLDPLQLENDLYNRRWELRQMQLRLEDYTAKIRDREAEIERLEAELEKAS